MNSMISEASGIIEQKALKEEFSEAPEAPPQKGTVVSMRHIGACTVMSIIACVVVALIVYFANDSSCNSKIEWKGMAETKALQDDLAAALAKTEEVENPAIEAKVSFPMSGDVLTASPALQKSMTDGMCAALGQKEENCKIGAVDGKKLSSRRLQTNFPTTEVTFIIIVDNPAAVEAMKNDVVAAGKEGSIVANIQKAAADNGVLPAALNAMEPKVTIAALASKIEWKDIAETKMAETKALQADLAAALVTAAKYMAETKALQDDLAAALASKIEWKDMAETKMAETKALQDDLAAALAQPKPADVFEYYEQSADYMNVEQFFNWTQNANQTGGVSNSRSMTNALHRRAFMREICPKDCPARKLTCAEKLYSLPNRGEISQTSNQDIYAKAMRCTASKSLVLTEPKNLNLTEMDALVEQGIFNWYSPNGKKSTGTYSGLLPSVAGKDKLGVFLETSEKIVATYYGDINQKTFPVVVETNCFWCTANSAHGVGVQCQSPDPNVQFYSNDNAAAAQRNFTPTALLTPLNVSRMSCTRHSQCTDGKHAPHSSTGYLRDDGETQYDGLWGEQGTKHPHPNHNHTHQSDNHLHTHLHTLDGTYADFVSSTHTHTHGSHSGKNQPFPEKPVLQELPCLLRPTPAPTKAPTLAPTKAPTLAPTKAPTKAPTLAPTKAPTKTPLTCSHRLMGEKKNCLMSKENLKKMFKDFSVQDADFGLDMCVFCVKAGGQLCLTTDTATQLLYSDTKYTCERDLEGTKFRVGPG